MKNTANTINPEDYILSVLSPKDRLDAAFAVARQAFKNSTLTMADVENAVKSIRRKAHEAQK
jgi:hypothetical protein